MLVAFASAADNSDDSLPTSTVVKQDSVELHLQDIVVDGARKINMSPPQENNR